jgi:transcriptional regulator with XRE-family HTH domain
MNQINFLFIQLIFINLELKFKQHPTPQLMTAKRIKQLRQLKDYTQEHLAIDADISQSQISKYETGECVPNAETLKKLAKTLDVEVFEFFYESNKEIKQAYERWAQRIV